MNKFIESHDLFGHIVNLNFNRNNNSHNTALGGLISILIKIFMIVYIGLISKKVVLSEGNDLSSEQFIYERSFGKDKVQLFNQTKMTVSHTLTKISNGMNQVKYDDEARKYIEIRYV